MLFDQPYQLGFAAWPGRPTSNQLSWSFQEGLFNYVQIVIFKIQSYIHNLNQFLASKTMCQS